MIISAIVLCVLATALQRITGLGFAMLVAPFAVVMMDTHQGVMFTMVLAVLASLSMMPSMWHDIQWSRFWWVGIPAVVLIPIASWIGTLFDSAWIYLMVGILVIIGLGGSLFMSRANIHVRGRTAQVVAGGVAGATSVLAGVGGPAMTIYGVLSRWPVMSFAATMQPLWIVVSVASLVCRPLFMGSTLPQFPWWAWGVCAVGILVGQRLGQWARKHISDRVAMAVVIAVAMIGAVLSVITGLEQVLGK